METAIIFILLIVAGDKLALWMESRGWIYWRKRKPKGGAFSVAVEELYSFLRPTTRHMIEAKKEDRKQTREKY